MNPLQQAFRCQFSEIAADCIFRESQFLAQILSDNLAGSAENLENVLLAMGGQHFRYYRTFLNPCCTK